jgi:membrane fusion protein, copper/silver efflux system
MKKYLLSAGFLVIGVFLGWLLFAGSNSNETANEHNHTADANEIWTCSMHPQIRKNEPGACPICGMDLIPLDENSSDNPFVLEMSEEAVKISQIQTTLVGGSNSQNSELELSGKIEVNETNSASLVTHIPGRIEKLYVSYTGEKVNKGQKIASIYSPTLITAQKELLEAQKIKGSQPQLFEAAKNKLKYWKITESQIQEILSQEEVIETFNIYAAYSGVVNERKVSVGDYKQEGNVLFEIQNLNSLWVVFDVYEKDISTINVGDVITFSTTSNPGKNYESKIVFIDPVLNSQTRTAKVRAEISNTASNLKPEMFVRGKLIGNEVKSSEIVVPKSAIMWTGTRSVVYVQLENTEIPSFEYREVVLGVSIGNNYEIKSGLSAGEYVVTQGAFVIDASAQLNNQASMMNQFSSPDKGNASDDVPDYVSSTSKEFKKQLEIVLNSYYTIKESLVNSDNKQASIASNKLLLNLQKTDMTLVKGDAHIYWMKKSNQLTIQANSIESTKEIAEQRKVFAQMSLSLIEVIKAFGIGGESYEMYCPMTNNKQGAYWLSAETEIRNPYYGDKMMGCGEIRNELSFE